MISFYHTLVFQGGGGQVTTAPSVITNPPSAAPSGLVMRFHVLVSLHWLNCIYAAASKDLLFTHNLLLNCDQTDHCSTKILFQQLYLKFFSFNFLK